MFRKSHKVYFVQGRKEDIFPTAELEENMYIHVIPEGGEGATTNEMSENSSKLTYPKKAYTETSFYDRVLNALKKKDTPYNPTVQKMQE